MGGADNFPSLREDQNIFVIKHSFIAFKMNVWITQVNKTWMGVLVHKQTLIQTVKKFDFHVK